MKMAGTQTLFTHKYGIRTSVALRPADVEAYAFRNKLQPHQGGLGTVAHFWNLADMLFPHIQKNDWMKAAIASLCEYNEVSWAGCGAAGKTFNAGLFAMVWWSANPAKSSVVMTSTTAKMIRKRMWPVIQELFRTAKGFPGRLVDSKMTLQAMAGNDKNAVSAIAIAEGSVQKAVGNIQGQHAERMLVIVDEATETPEAIFDACSNLRKGCTEFKLLLIGNPASKFDMHGKFSEPKNGWGSVDIDTEEWETKTGICVRFDGAKSPNVLAGKTVCKYLITKKQFEDAEKNEGLNNPKFWKFTRGFWPEDGFIKTVITETLAFKHDLTRKIIFGGNVKKIAGLDPAFCGGDRCILRFGRLGKTLGGVTVLMSDEIIHITPDARLSEPVHYQIAERVTLECEKRGVLPNHFAMDSSGEGGGLADILTREWGTIVRVEFGGGASDKPISEEDNRPSSEQYDRRVTELWFSVQKWAMADKIGGLDTETLRELCTRLYDDSKRKTVLETKQMMKKRSQKSPDLADAFVVLVELARQLIGTEVAKESISDRAWMKNAIEMDSIYKEENTFTTNVEEEEYAQAY